MLEYARWKYILVGVVLAVALLFALPNLFGDDYAIADRPQGSQRRSTRRSSRASKPCSSRPASPSRASTLDHGNVIVRFADNDAQLKAPRRRQGREERASTTTYVNAMMYASRAPRWMQALGLRAMPLGLDLRGGLYLLYQVDVERRGRASCSPPTTRISAARCNTEKIPFTDITSLHGRFGYSQWPARAAAGGRGSRRRCVPRSRRRSPISPAATPWWPRAPRSIA